MSFFTIRKADTIKVLLYISSHTFQLIPRYWPGVSCIYEIVIAFIFFFLNIPHLGYFFRKSSAFSSALIISRYTIIFICTCSIYSPEIFRREILGSQFIGDLKLLWNKFCSVSTINSMCAVLCSVTVSEGLKVRKSLAISYWQDPISGNKVNSNVRNNNNLWGVSTTFVILYRFSFYHCFFQFMKCKS